MGGGPLINSLQSTLARFFYYLAFLRTPSITVSMEGISVSELQCDFKNTALHHTKPLQRTALQKNVCAKVQFMSQCMIK